MDSNYLEEIKIIKRPRPKNPDRKPAQPSGLKDKTSLIETLRTKEKKVEEEQAKISADDILKLKAQLARRNSSARTLPSTPKNTYVQTASEVSVPLQNNLALNSAAANPLSEASAGQKILPAAQISSYEKKSEKLSEKHLQKAGEIEKSDISAHKNSEKPADIADAENKKAISQKEMPAQIHEDIFDKLSDRIDSWAIDIIGIPDEDELLSDGERQIDEVSSLEPENQLEVSEDVIQDTKKDSQIETYPAESPESVIISSTVENKTHSDNRNTVSPRETRKAKAALEKEAKLAARQSKFDARNDKLAEKQKLAQSRAEEKARIRAAKQEKKNKNAVRKAELKSAEQTKRAERKARHTASDKLLQAKNKLAQAKPKKLGNHVILKYLIKELSVYFIVSFAFFFVIFFVNEILVLAETILRQHVPVLSVIRLILYKLPAIVAQSAPFATLVGFLMCLGRIVTDNEMLVLRASGFKYSYIAVPVVIIGLVISILSFVMNDYFLPLGSLKFNRLRRQIVQKDPAVQIEENSVKRINGTTLIIGGVNNENVIDDLVIFDTDSSGRDRVIVTGKSNLNKSTEEGILMQFNMSGSTVFQLDRQNYSKFDVVESQKVLLNVFDTFVQDLTDIAPSEMTSLDLHKSIQDLKNDKTITKLKLNRYNLEFYKKFSLPFGSIFFAILAFPLALVFGKKDGQTLGLIFGIIISVIYWAATILGQMFGVRSGYNGFWMMWTPNILIGILGILLYLRLRKK